MAVSVKGFRKIIVNDELYLWKVNKKIIILKEQKKSNRIEVDFGWFDEWLYINDQNNRPSDYELKNITPKFIEDCIKFAIDEGWCSGMLLLKFRGGNFYIHKD